MADQLEIDNNSGSGQLSNFTKAISNLGFPFENAQYILDLLQTGRFLIFFPSGKSDQNFINICNENGALDTLKIPYQVNRL